MNKADKIANTLTNIGKKLTLFITVPILLSIFLGWVGVIIGIAFLVLLAIGNKKKLN